jgi:hypothetical protein
VLARGFARWHCGGCGFERLVALSCKGRGFCPSCGGKRMTGLSADLTDRVTPFVPVRQFVLSVPHRVRYLLAYDHARCIAVLRIFIRALLSFYRLRARKRGAGRRGTGSVTFVQRFGSAATQDARSDVREQFGELGFGRRLRRMKRQLAIRSFGEYTVDHDDVRMKTAAAARA